MTENYNTAWLSLKDTLLHIIWAEDSWINYSINNFEDPNRPFDFSKYDSWEKIVIIIIESFPKLIVIL
jgi:hypothetical protein